MNKKLRSEWEDFGLLSNTSDERKDDLCELLNLSIDYVINHKYVGITETLFIPIIVRIYNIIDIKFNDVIEIILELEEQYNKFFLSNKNPNADQELDFCTCYSEKYVENKLRI